DRRSDAHRFANGEPEARVTDRVEDEAVARHQPRQLVVRNLAEPADRLRPEPDEIERDLLADGVEHVRAEPPAASGEPVDDDETPLDLPGVAHVRWHEHPVL